MKQQLFVKPVHIQCHRQGLTWSVARTPVCLKVITHYRNVRITFGVLRGPLVSCYQLYAAALYQLLSLYSEGGIFYFLLWIDVIIVILAIFVLLEAHFLAAIQIIVYAGAIMVLFLFVIMLLNLGHDYQKDLKVGAFSLVSFATVGAMAYVLSRQLGAADLSDSGPGAAAIDAAIAQHGVVGAIAQPLYTTYVVPFEITGILLLVAIVGALVLAKKNVA